MGPDEKAALLKRYSERLAQYGPTVAALGWTKPTHLLRYRVLLEYWLSRPTSPVLRVLDFGCGFGDLYDYSRRKGLPLDYTGLDINPDLVQVARQRHPAARFLCIDPFSDSLHERFDVVLSSGVHNYRLADNRGYVERSFELFDRCSAHGFAVNFLSSRVTFRREENYYSVPEEMLALALRYSSRVSLRHDYMPFEFTVFVDKRNHIDPDLTVFQPYVDDCER